MKGTSTARFSFSQRIERPVLNYLNPYVYLIDPRNISYGNPKLHPTISNVFNLSYNTYINSSSISATVFYHFTNNSIQQFTSLGSDLVARTTFGNIATNKTAGFSLNGNTTLFKKLTLNLNTTSTYVKYSSSFVSKAKKGFIFNVTGYSSFLLARVGGQVATLAIVLQIYYYRENQRDISGITFLFLKIFCRTTEQPSAFL